VQDNPTKSAKTTQGAKTRHDPSVSEPFLFSSLFAVGMRIATSRAPMRASTSGALGANVGCLASNVWRTRSAPGTREPGSASGAYVAGPRSPRSSPLADRTPGEMRNTRYDMLHLDWMQHMGYSRAPSRPPLNIRSIVPIR